MNRSKTAVEEVVGILDERLQDIASLVRQDTRLNIMSVIEGINDRENQRLRQMGKLELQVNEYIREEPNQLLTEIGRYLHESTMKLFSRMHKDFKIEPVVKYENTRLISLFRRFFIEINDIRMLGKLDEMFKNKALKKPIVIMKLLKLLADIVREHLHERMRVANVNVSENEIEEYYKHKREVLKSLTLDGIIESKISRNMLAIRPIFMIQSFSKPQETKVDETRLGNLKKLKEKWQKRLSKNQDERERDRGFIKLNFQTENKRTYSNNATPVDSLVISSALKDTQSQNQNLTIPSVVKSQSAPIVQKTFTIKLRRSQDRVITTCHSHKPGFKNYSGPMSYKDLYGDLDLQQKFISKMFLKKSRRYYPETELKMRLERNSDVLRQIGSFKRRGTL